MEQMLDLNKHLQAAKAPHEGDGVQPPRRGKPGRRRRDRPAGLRTLLTDGGQGGDRGVGYDAGAL